MILNILTFAQVPLLLYLIYITVSYLKLHKKQMPFLSSLGSKPIDSGVLIVVPAKDEEEGIGRCLHRLSKLKGLSKYKIIAVNDRSDDQTGPRMERARDASPDIVDVLNISALPSGWLGKNHACWQGFQKGISVMPDAEYVLFTDGDVKMHPDTIAESITWMNKNEIDFMTLIEHAEYEGVLEPAYLMLFGIFVVFFSTRPWLLHEANGKNFMGNGAYLLVRRDVYEKTQGHLTLKLEVVEDLRMGLLMRSRGFRCATAVGLNRISRRWQAGFTGIFKGLLKNFFAAFDYSIPTTIAGMLAFPFIFLAPWLGLFSNYPFIGIANIIMVAFCYYLASKDSELPFLTGFLLSPFISLVASANLATSAILILIKGGVQWRDSFYSLKELKAHCFTVRKAFAKKQPT